MNDKNDDNAEDNMENNNDKFNNDIDKDFINNISEELQMEMRMLQAYNNFGKMVGSFYMGLIDNVGEELTTQFTEIFISNYVYNLFNSFGGERK